MSENKNLTPEMRDELRRTIDDMKNALREEKLLQVTRTVMSNLSGFAMGSGADLKQAANSYRALSGMPPLDKELAWDHLVVLLERLFDGSATTAELTELLSSFYTAGLLNLEEVAQAVEHYEQVLLFMSEFSQKGPAEEEKKAAEPSPAQQEQNKRTASDLEEILKRLSSAPRGDGKRSDDSQPPPPPPSGKGTPPPPPPPPPGGAQLNPVMLAIVGGVGLVVLLLSAKKKSDSQHISFQDFLTRYLVHGSVGKLVVSNGETVAVYPKTSDPGAQPIATFRIGSVDHFEKVFFFSLFSYHSYVCDDQALEAAERELHIREDDRVPVLYRNGGSVIDVLIKLSPTLLIIGALIALGRSNAARAGGSGGAISKMRKRIVSFNFCLTK